MYHFLSGYTAKVAGTEAGVTEPKATFSTCFGEPFMVRPPSVYADLLGQKIRRHDARCWLVNTGMTGGPHGVGHRIELAHTRAMVDAILDGTLQHTARTTEPVFDLSVPDAVPNVPDAILTPRRTWDDPRSFDQHARRLVDAFAENFTAYADTVEAEVRAAGPTPEAVHG
jgi:phosphoenolpyruvate carboxykinase (ATP)